MAHASLDTVRGSSCDILNEMRARGMKDSVRLTEDLLRETVETIG